MFSDWCYEKVFVLVGGYDAMDGVGAGAGGQWLCGEA